MKCMKKSVACLFLVLFLFACATSTKKDVAQTGDFRSGSEGVRMEFLANMPPARVFDNVPFDVVIQIENMGATDIGESGGIYLSGFDKSIVSFGSLYEPFPKLRGRSAYVSKGDYDAITFSGTIKQLENIDKYQPTIMATACYDYSTIASAQVCLDPDPFNPRSSAKVCTPSAVSLSTQGAPIAVTSVQVEPSLGTTRFTINLANVGTGDVFDFLSMPSCSPYSGGLSFQEIDIIRVSKVSVMGTDITQSCRPLDKSNNVRLNGGKGFLFCEISGLPGKSAFLSPLTVELVYGYRQSTSKSVEIRKGGV